MRTYNITQTYVEENDPWLGILAASAFSIFSTTNRLKYYGLVQLMFGHDMIFPIKHKVGWGLIHQQKQTQINIDHIRKNRNRVDHYYNIGDKVMLNNHTTYEY